MSLVFQNIDPPPPSPPGECVLPPPPNKGGGGGWGVNILEDCPLTVIISLRLYPSINNYKEVYQGVFSAIEAGRGQCEC
jgi:hypothetical protein